MRISTVSRTALALCIVAAAAAPGAAGDDDAEKKATAEAARTMQERREADEKAANEAFAKLDKSGDGTLRGAELPAGFVDRYDRNGDNVVGRSEFVEVMSRPPKARHLHFMRDARARAARSMGQYDQDKNALVERKEFPGNDAQFKRADRNKDEKLQPSELLAMAEDELEDVRRQMKDPGPYEFFNVYDLDYDRRITPDEYDGPVAVFRKYDTDKDGVVLYDEVFGDMMARYANEQPKPENLNVVEQLDTDKNGKVTREEFKGSDSVWARLDKNGDGVITVADGH
jgi:Ca2+-binding EF-hand superfamily protein